MIWKLLKEFWNKWVANGSQRVAVWPWVHCCSCCPAISTIYPFVLCMSLKYLSCLLLSLVSIQFGQWLSENEIKVTSSFPIWTSEQFSIYGKVISRLTLAGHLLRHGLLVMWISGRVLVDQRNLPLTLVRPFKMSCTECCVFLCLWE